LALLLLAVVVVVVMDLELRPWILNLDKKLNRDAVAVLVVEQVLTAVITSTVQVRKEAEPAIQGTEIEAVVLQ
jgi:hypothetical protein